MPVLTNQQLIDLVASLAIKSTELSESQKQTDKQMKETDRQMNRTDEKLKRIGITVGNMGRNNGAVAEEFFYSSLSKTKKLGGIKYDEIGREWKKDLKNIRGEYDIILINGKEVAIVEVKYKIHHNDVEKMEKKIADFKVLFPNYKDYRIKGAFASLSMSKKSEDEILNNGYFALKQVGKHMEVHSPV